MTTYIALLRGINVGKAKRVSMADLRGVVADLGFSDFATILQSGNVVFGGSGRADDIAAQVEKAVANEIGVQSKVIVRTRAQLARVVAADPFADVATDPSRYLVTFLSGRVSRTRLHEVDPDDHLPNLFQAGSREIYVWCPDGVMGTRLDQAYWQSVLGDLTVTARNWRTVTRVLAIADEVDAR